MTKSVEQDLQLQQTVPKLNQTIETALTVFLQQHKEHLPNNLHLLAVQAIEKPLLKLLMQHYEQNQSNVAKVLGINRATLRRKLIDYRLWNETI